MFNNSTNINKTNNNLSPKESVNSDGQQFYQNQQNRWEIIVCFVDIGGIVDLPCLNFFKVRGYSLTLRKLKQWRSTIVPTLTKQTIISRLKKA
jgi:hypothetical protein